MSFVSEFNALPMSALLRTAAEGPLSAVDRVLQQGASTLADFATLLSPAAAGRLETLCHRSQTLTRQRFGKVIRLFAPLYLSNECINNCAYCGFSRDNAILAVSSKYAARRCIGETKKAQKSVCISGARRCE